MGTPSVTLLQRQVLILFSLQLLEHVEPYHAFNFGADGCERLGPSLESAFALPEVDADMARSVALH